MEWYINIRMKKEKNLIRCSCGFPLIEEKNNKTRKTLIIKSHVDGRVYFPKIEIGSSEKPFDKIKNTKIPFTIECPRCGKATSLYLLFGKLNGITFSFKDGASEIINNKQIEIAKKEERKIRDVYLKFER